MKKIKQNSLIKNIEDMVRQSNVYIIGVSEEKSINTWRYNTWKLYFAKRHEI